MVTIRMLVSMAGPEVTYVPGHLYEVSEVIAEAWKEAGIAISVADPAPVQSEPAAVDVETASAQDAPERAARVRRPR